MGFLSKDAREAVRIAEIELGEEFEWARNLVGEAEDGADDRADDGDVEWRMTGWEVGGRQLRGLLKVRMEHLGAQGRL